MGKNKFLKSIFIGITILISTFSMVSCNKQLNDTPLENMNVIADFYNGKNDTFVESDGWCNSEPFNVTWSQNNIKYENGAAKLFITESDSSYYSGELRSNDHFSYGDYEITMRPEAKKGTCTSFFVYTGPTEFNTEGNPNPHDEIDIEFLGKDTTRVQFNFFVNGKGGNEYSYELGFDASKEFHRYGFRWTESYITWYVDGTPVYRVNKTFFKKLPTTPGRMMLNYWCGTKKAEAWMSSYSNPEVGEGSEYKLIKTSATPIVDESNGEDPTPTTQIDWSKVDALVGLAAYSSDDKHTIITNGTEYNVKYTDVAGGSYNNVKFELGNAAEGMNYLHLKVTNNSTDKIVNLRVDVFGEASNTATNNKNVCNVSATMNGKTVPTDLDAGGSVFDAIPAGETVEIEIYFEGNVESLQIMFDSAVYNDTNVYSGDVTISDIQFTKA